MALTSSSTAPITRYPRRASIPSLVPGDRRTGVSSASCGIRQLSFCARLIGGGRRCGGPTAAGGEKLQRDSGRCPGEPHRDGEVGRFISVSYTHLRAHETVLDLVCR